MSRPVAVALALILFLVLGGTFLLRTEAPGDVDAPVGGRPVAATESAVSPSPSSTPAAERDVVARRAEPVRAPGSPPASYEASLGVIVGRVVDHDLVALPDLPVERLGGNVFQLLPAEDDWFADVPPDLSFSVDAVRTDADGRFRFERVDPHGFFMLGVDLAGARATYRPVDTMPNPGEIVDLGDIVLDPVATLVGRVVDEGGAPIAGARVRASELPVEAFRFGLGDVRPGCAVTGKMPGERDWRVLEAPPVVMALLRRLPYREAQTDADGEFRMEAVPVGTLTLLADDAGRVSAVRGPIVTRAGEERRVPELALQDGETLVGTVVRGAEEEPVEGVEVRVGAPVAIFPAALLLPAAKTDAEGRFAVDGLREVPHVVAVRPPDSSAWTLIERVDPGLDEPVIRLGETVTLSLLAQDAAGEVVPAPRVLVQAHPDLDLGELGGASFLLSPPLPLAGRTEPRADGGVRVTGLDRTRYRVLVKADGFGSSELEVDLRDGSKSVEVAMEREVDASVHVVAAGTGAPIEWALVSAFGVEDDDLLPLVTRRTDANGVAFLDGLLAGTTRVRVFHPAFAMAETTLVAPGPPGVVELSGGGVLRGTVFRDGAPVETPHWVFVLPGEDGATPLPRITRTGEGGTYRVTHLRAGTYEVGASDRFGDGDDGGSSAGGGARFSFGDEGPPGGEDKGVTLKIGASFGVGDGPAEEPAVSEEPGDGGVGDRMETRTAVVVEGEETILDFDTHRLEGAGPRARLLGRVVLNGVSAKGLEVVARSERGGRAARRATTNGAGVFDLGEVPAGKAVVRVLRPSGGGAFAERRVTLAPADVSEVEFRIVTGSLQGTVRSAKTGRSLPYATVRLRPAEGGEGGALDAATGVGGRFAFDVVPAGEYMVVAESPGHVRVIEGPVVVPERGAATPVAVTLRGSVDVRGRVELPSAAGAAPYVFVHFAPSGDAAEAGAAGFGGFAFADPATRAFEVEDVAPGAYAVQIFGAEEGLAPVPLVVPESGLEGVVIRPEIEG